MLLAMIPAVLTLGASSGVPLNPAAPASRDTITVASAEQADSFFVKISYLFRM